MTLGALIQFLEKLDPKMVVPEGFHRPHSYRGYYDELAFEPKPYVTVKEMLKAAKSAVSETYRGYKGGDFTMTPSTTVWVANEGSTVENHLSEELLCQMFEIGIEELGVLQKKTFTVGKDGKIEELGISLPKKYKGKEVEVIVKLK